ncbi:hypothetical protein SSOG_03489, partial [Streptomyces himastatinicus ATCC 53653]
MAGATAARAADRAGQAPPRLRADALRNRERIIG